MPFGCIKKAGHRFVTALMVSTAALCASCLHAFAEDQNMTVLAHASSGPLQCEIRKNETGTTVELTGIIASSAAVAGNFRFAVMKSGPSGSSNINQANKFDLAAGQETQIGQVKINLDRNIRVVIEFSAASNDGVECRVQASLEH
jgi:hypothetical protein